MKRKRLVKAKPAKRRVSMVRRNTSPKHRKRNSGEFSAAQDLYETFHGRPSEETIVVTEEVEERSSLAGLGKLIELEVITLSGFEVEIEFDTHRPMLASSPDGKQLYIMGGDQQLDLEQLEMDGPEWLKDLMVIGILTQVTYETQKAFHQFQLIDYYHDLGEESGVQPLLVYDTLNRRLSVVGGQYEVKFEGIVN